MPRKPKSKSKGSSARPLAAEAEEDVVAARTFLAAEGLAGSLAGHSGEEMMSRVMAMLSMGAGEAGDDEGVEEAPAQPGSEATQNSALGALDARSPESGQGGTKSDPGGNSNAAAQEAALQESSVRAAASLNVVQVLAKAACSLALTRQTGAWWRPVSHSYSAPASAAGHWAGPGTLSGRALLDLPSAGAFCCAEDASSDPASRMAHQPVPGGAAAASCPGWDASGLSLDETAALCGAWALLATADDVAVARATADAAGPVAKWLARCEKACGAVPSADSLALQSEALWLLVNLTGGRFALPRYGDAGAVEEEGGEDDDVGLGGSLGGGGAGLGATSDAAFGAAAVLGNGILPVLVALLGSSRLEVVERAAWVVGNVAGVGVGARDAVLSARVAGVLCSLVEMVCASVKQWLVRFDTMQGAVTGAGSAGKRPRRRASKGGRALSGARRPAHGHADDGGNSDGEDGASSGGASSGGTSSEYDEDNSDDDDDDALPVSATRPHSGALASAVASLAAAGASVRPLPGPSERVPPVIVDRAPELLRVLVWSLARLCDGLPRAGTSPAVVVPALVRVLELHASEGPPFLPAATHAAWALSHRCDGSAPDIRLALRLGALPLLVGLLRPDRSVWRLCKPALRAVGNIVCAEDDRDFTDEVVAAGAVPRLASLVGHPNREIEKEACWTLSNIAAGTDTQIQSVIDSQRLPALADVALSAASDPGVRTEASWVILNATSCGSDAQVAPLVHAGAVRVLACLLADSAMGQMAAEGLSKLLRVSERLMEASDSRGG
ncbi:hypothetical protein FNF27_04606 [Cafeteria roenbergensis]|uniref:IBB domain-containing protein n=1 Tax=Cafeteria roenbergensis TaxID=33653 RepID=A0A5A8E8N4_CAFRO|nr:hypothetical protein FNF27_04606 [Cafeteria roenbergensis]